jgi:hypothetical protein
MPDTITREATCGCGQLRVTATGDPDIVVACNCLACQRRTGSPFGVGAYYRKDAISVEGAEKTFGRVAQSGLDVEGRFCPDCGTSVYWTAELRPDHYGVAVGCFGDPSFIPPARVVWSENKHAWVGFPKGVQMFEQATPAQGLKK